MTRPDWITLPRVAILALVCTAVFLLWPRADHAPSAAEENGYRIASRLPLLRRDNAERLAFLTAAKAATDAKLAVARGTLRRAADTAAVFVGAVHLDSAADRVVIGPYSPADTLVPLPMARARIQWLADTAQAVITSLQAVIMVERGRAAVAITSLNATIAAQDTVVAGLRAELHRKAPPWYVRAERGIEHAGAAIACGGAGYVLGGPIGGLGAGLACAALAGVVR